MKEKKLIIEKQSEKEDEIIIRIGRRANAPSSESADVRMLCLTTSPKSPDVARITLPAV